MIGSALTSSGVEASPETTYQSLQVFSLAPDILGEHSGKSIDRRANRTDPMTETVHAEPTKDFFVRMITRDITLEDCILDLVDNCIDGANKTRASNTTGSDQPSFKGYTATIELTPDHFRISDNCGGISTEVAKNYAFHFGRPSDAPAEAEFSIGLYGIGMKRAIFKLGEHATVRSTTVDDAFEVVIDVPEWQEKPEGDWSFALTHVSRSDTPGTVISVDRLHSTTSGEFADQVFLNQLAKVLSRDYSFFLQRGFQIELNGVALKPYEYMLRESSEFQPLRSSHDNNGVTIDIVAGLAGLPPDDTSPESEDPKASEYFGWFIACNDRIVLAADKTDATVWGHDGFPTWHQQYAGFMGIVNFKSSNKPHLLPWTTTKREIEYDDPVYRQARTKMKEITRDFIQYTNHRKKDPDYARTLEQKAEPTPVDRLPRRDSLSLPRVAIQKPSVAHINYQVEKEKARKVAIALGDPSLSYRAIGLETFNYVYGNEVDD